ncbi:MAG TPA: hypothetical protein VFU21_19425 [Kofleriaceae bacterium]|nr:hypothetical protein [Kofleriaceae bacterium]
MKGLLAAPLATWLVAAATAGLAAAQPDWLPPEVRRPTRTPSPFGEAAAADPDDPCADPLLAPIAPPVRDSGFDRAIDACLAGGWSASARGAALIDTPDFYGTAAASLFLDVRHLLLRDLEIGGGVRAVDARFAQNAVIAEDEVGAGPLYLAAAATLGRHHLGGRPLRLAWGLRLDLPWTDTTYGSTAVVAATPQVAAALGLSPRLALHARLAALLWLVRPPDDVQTRRAAALSSDLVWTPFRALAVAAGVEAQTGWYGATLDHLLVRGGLRVPFRCRNRLHLGAAAPLLGDERTDLIGELTYTHDW